MRVPQTVGPLADADQSRRARRAERHSARQALWVESSLKRVRLCGRRVSTKQGVTVRASGAGVERRAGFSGLATCGSVWACPCCATKVLAGRQVELTAALNAWTATGGRVVMLTLTMRHFRGQGLRQLWDGLAYAWGKVTSGRQWQDTQAAYGAPVERVVTSGKRKGQLVTENRVGWVRVVETTHGDNGWHVHAHVALLVPGSTDVQAADELGCAMFQVWRDALVRKGFAAPLARHGGLHAKLWDGSSAVMGEYFTKNEYSADASAAALELARGDLKVAREGHRTPFRILGDVLLLGQLDDLELWKTWEQGSHRRRQMTWSVGLRGRLLPDVADLTDEELAQAAELAGEALVVISSAGWAKVCRYGLAAQLLDSAEADDTGLALRALLDAWGIRWKVPPTESAST